jgi:hypothetical protein
VSHLQRQLLLTLSRSSFVRHFCTLLLTLSLASSLPLVIVHVLLHSLIIAILAPPSTDIMDPMLVLNIRSVLGTEKYGCDFARFKRMYEELTGDQWPYQYKTVDDVAKAFPSVVRVSQ